MDNSKFNELIEKAKQASKEDFLRFVTGIYDIDESFFEHIWDVPIIAPWEGDCLVKTSLSTKTEEELLEMVDDFIASELGEADGCFISLSKMESEFSKEELDELRAKLENGELKLDYNAIIVYNEQQLQKKYKDLIKENSNAKNPKTKEEINQIFIDYVKEVITHERCHLNANYFVTEVDKYVDNGSEKAERSSSEVNGASLTNIEQSNIISSDEDTVIINKYNEERNEVLIDTLRQMMNNYQDGDTIEDCLYRIIKDRNGKSQYDDIDDKEVLTMYMLFPEELTKWTIFGAYDFYRENILKKMLIQVCGTDEPLQFGQFKKNVREYLKDKEVSEKQLQMLDMLGISIERKISKEDMKDGLISRKELGSFVQGYLLDFIQKRQTKDNSQER